MSALRVMVGLVGCVLATACGDWPDPVIRSITPAQMPASASTRIEVAAELPLPTLVNYETGTIEVDSALELSIGNQQLEIENVSPEGLITATVPTLLMPGAYDVEVRLADDRAAVLPDGFIVTDGQWPDSYSIDPIGTQRDLAPFTITVRAQGANAAGFSGNVRLVASQGATIQPTLSAAFVNGVLVQQVTMTSPSTQVSIRVSDLVGKSGTSSPFNLE